MNFFQRIGNALSRFMYGRNGVDRLCLTMIWTALLLDVINLFLRDRQSVVYSILAFVSTVIVFLALYRMFSRNLEKRRSENARFMEKVWNPVSRRIAGSRQQRMDKAHKYFTCPNCKTALRVPRGHGKVNIVCRKCGTSFTGKT